MKYSIWNTNSFNYWNWHCTWLWKSVSCWHWKEKRGIVRHFYTQHLCDEDIIWRWLSCVLRVIEAGKHKDKWSDELMINVRGFQVRMRINYLCACFPLNDLQVGLNKRKIKGRHIKHWHNQMQMNERRWRRWSNIYWSIITWGQSDSYSRRAVTVLKNQAGIEDTVCYN